MDKEYDVIIVGAGLGGLATGAKLSREGLKVLMVEQHNVVGGCATMFKRGKRKFEVGLHEMGSLARQSRIDMFQDLDIYDRLEFIRVPEFFRVKRGNFDAVFADEADEAKENLKKQFPRETKAIDKFFSDVTQIRKESYRFRWDKTKKMMLGPFFPLLVRNLIKYKNYSAGQYLDELTDDEDLKLTLIANLGYYHDDPYTLSFLLFMLGQSSYIYGGGWFVKGGSQKLSDAMADVIRENDGEIILRHMVNEIIVENGKAIGIKYQKKKNDTEGEKIIYANFVVANASMLNVVDQLIPSLEGSEIQQNLHKLELPCSLMTIYYSFKEPISKYFDNIYSTFFYNDKGKTLKDMAKYMKTSDYKEKDFVFVDYHTIDSGMNSDESYTASLCAVDYMNNWEHLSEDDYYKQKEDVITTFNKRLEEKFPGITALIDRVELSTPKTIRKYTLNPQGTVYGFAQTPEQALKNKSKMIDIDRLFFASAWVMVGGFGGSLSSGYGCAHAILKKMEKENIAEINQKSIELTS